MANIVKKVKRKLYEVYHGKTAYMPGHKMMPVSKQTRTSQVEGGLKQAGIDQDVINRMKGRKK